MPAFPARVLHAGVRCSAAPQVGAGETRSLLLRRHRGAGPRRRDRETTAGNAHPRSVRCASRAPVPAVWFAAAPRPAELRKPVNAVVFHQVRPFCHPGWLNETSPFLLTHSETERVERRVAEEEGRMVAIGKQTAGSAATGDQVEAQPFRTMVSFVP